MSEPLILGDDDAALTPTAAAYLLEVHPNTVIRWSDQGMLPVQRTPNGHRRFRAADVHALMRRRATAAHLLRGYFRTTPTAADVEAIETARTYLRAACSLLGCTSDHLRDAGTEEHTALGASLADVQVQAGRLAHELDELVQQERGGDR